MYKGCVGIRVVLMLHRTHVIGHVVSITLQVIDVATISTKQLFLVVQKVNKEVR